MKIVALIVKRFFQDRCKSVKHLCGTGEGVHTDIGVISMFNVLFMLCILRVTVEQWVCIVALLSRPWQGRIRAVRWGLQLQPRHYTVKLPALNARRAATSNKRNKWKHFYLLFIFDFNDDTCFILFFFIIHAASNVNNIVASVTVDFKK